MTLRLALDQNFPTPLIKAAKPWLGAIELRHTFEIDPRLSVMDDWELLIALLHHPDGYAGVVTSDGRMLGQARELAALQQTGLSLVVAEGSGHDPVKATGLVLTHITHIAGQIAKKKSQIWALGSHAPRPKGPRDYLGIIASRGGKSIDQAFNEARVDEATLRRNPLEPRRVR